MSTPAALNPKKLIAEQAIPQIEMLIMLFDQDAEKSTKGQKRVRDAAVEFRDALKEWAEEK